MNVRHVAATARTNSRVGRQRGVYVSPRSRAKQFHPAPPSFSRSPFSPVAVHLTPMSAQADTAGPKLVRALGPFIATAVVVGTVIGSGVFKKPQAVAEHVPDVGWAAAVWIVGGV